MGHRTTLKIHSSENLAGYLRNGVVKKDEREWLLTKSIYTRKIKSSEMTDDVLCQHSECDQTVTPSRVLP